MARILSPEQKKEHRQIRAEAAVPRSRRLCSLCNMFHPEATMDFVDDPDNDSPVWVCKDFDACMDRYTQRHR